MRKKLFFKIIIIYLLVISLSSACQANIVGIFPADWGMSVEEVKAGINNSQDFEYVGEDYTTEKYSTYFDYYCIEADAYCYSFLDGYLLGEEQNDYIAYFVFDDNYQLRFIQCYQLSSAKSYYYDFLQRYERFKKDSNITDGNNYEYREDWLDEDYKPDNNFETMADYEDYDWEIWIGNLEVFATMETDETITDLILYYENEVIFSEINFYDGKYFN